MTLFRSKAKARNKEWSLLTHVILLALFTFGMIGLWLLPVLVMGDPWEVHPLLLARNLAESGVFSIQDVLGRFIRTAWLQEIGVPSAIDGRLNALFYAWKSPWIGWENLTGWSALAAGITGLSLVALWDAIRRWSNVRTAWIATVLYAFFPIIWQRAVIADNYPIAYLFLFLAFDLFLALRKRSLLWACIAAGIAMGLSLAAKDVFMLFLPWFVLVFFWAHRKQWKKVLVPAAAFVVCIGAMYLLPYLGDIGRYGYPVNQNIARIWPGADQIANESYLHLYPDPYTYLFDRRRFNAEHLAAMETWPLLTRIQEQKVLIGYGLSGGIVYSILNSFWLFVHALPGIVQLSTVGGPLLWLLIIPGCVALWREERFTLLALGGLTLALYLELSFILHYEREHLMDIAWVLAILAAVGIKAVALPLATAWKRISPVALVAVITLGLVLHLLLVNRLEFARLYAKSSVPESRAAAASVVMLPINAVVLVPGHPNDVASLALFTDRTIVLMQRETVQRLLEKGQFDEAAYRFGATHALGYEADQFAAMKGAYAQLAPVEIQPTPPASTSPLLRYFLQVIR